MSSFRRNLLLSFYMTHKVIMTVLAAILCLLTPPLSSNESPEIPAKYKGKIISARPHSFHQKLLALTIDDGPDPVITPRNLDTLKSHHAHATFFVLGQSAARHPDLLK